MGQEEEVGMFSGGRDWGRRYRRGEEEEEEEEECIKLRRQGRSPSTVEFLLLLLP
jgi:hypothetical protein